MQKLYKYIEKHFIPMIISAIISALCGWMINWILPASPVKASNIPKKEITCTLNYYQKLITKNISDDNFKIIYNNEEVSDPYIFNITITNTGNYAIQNEDFKKEFSINFEGSNKIINASVDKSSNDDICDEIIQNSRTEGTKIIITNFFLNPNETFTLSIITDKKPTAVKYDSRIKDTSNLELINTPAEKVEKIKSERFIISAVTLSAFTIAVVTLIILFIVDKTQQKKHQQELQELIISSNKTSTTDIQKERDE